MIWTGRDQPSEPGVQWAFLESEPALQDDPGVANGYD